MINDPTRRFDGLMDASGGMDSSVSPEVLAGNRVALGVNIITRNGWPGTRPRFFRRNLWDTTWKTFASGFFQGAGTYSNPVTGGRKLIAVSSGRIFAIDEETFETEDLTPAAGGNDPTARCFFRQAENFLIINNGEDYPLIYDGKSLRRTVKDGKEVPVGTIMAYGLGRLFVASPDRAEIIAGDLVFGGSIARTEILRTDGENVILANHRGVPQTYAMTRVTTRTAHGLKDGDKVTIRHHNSEDVLINSTWFISDVTEMSFAIPFSTSKFGGGGTVEKFSSGAESDLLRFTETDFLNEKGVFRIPATMGLITGMEFFPVQDTAKGQGDLLVLGERGAATFAVSAPRETWLDIAIQKVALTHVGATSPTAVVPVNSDIFFRSADGLRSFRNSTQEFSQAYGSTPMSSELGRILEHDSVPLLEFASAVLFDNRLLFSASPKAHPTLDGDPFGVQPVTFSSLAVLDFHNASRVSKQGTPCFDGIWTGLNTLQLVSARFGQDERCFSFARAADGTTELWEITKDFGIGTDIKDSPGRIAFLADCGYSTAPAQRVAAMVKRHGATDVVLAGDTNYEDGLAVDFDANLGAHWRSFMFPFNGSAPLHQGESPATVNHLWACPGNHDWDANDNLAAFKAYTNAPANYYSQRFGDVELFFMDSDFREPDGITGVGFPSVQWQWLLDQVAASQARWKGVVLHHSPYTSGTGNGPTAIIAGWGFHDFIGVDFVVSGHEHLYERIMKPGPFPDSEGVPYFVVGTGGAPLNSFGTPCAGSTVRYAGFGALFMDVDADSLTFTFRDDNGIVRDTHTLTQPHASKPRTPRIVRTERKISAAIETRAFAFESPFANKKIVRGDLWLSEIQGGTNIRVFWRPDVHPRWFYWGAFSQSATAVNPAGTVSPVTLLPAIAPQVMLATPPKVDDADVKFRPAHLGYTFQIRIEWEGAVRLQKLLLHAVDMPEQVQALAPADPAVARWVSGQSGDGPQPKPTELLAHST
jgi:hypothetical protein